MNKENSDPATLTGAQLDTAASLMLEVWEFLRLPLPPSALTAEDAILDLHLVFTLSPEEHRVDRVTRTLHGHLMMLGIRRDAKAKAWCNATGRIISSFLLSICDY